LDKAATRFRYLENAGLLLLCGRHCDVLACSQQWNSFNSASECRNTFRGVTMAVNFPVVEMSYRNDPDKAFSKCR